MKITLKPILFFALSLFSCFAIAGDESSNHSHAHEDQHPALSGALFISDLVEVAEDLVACTLVNGTETKCLSITVKAPEEVGHSIGPWCPRNISDGAESAGIWLKDGNVYDADGQFIKNLAELYQDEKWELYNPKTGEVKVTDSKESCLAAARPDVDPRYQNHCVECLPSYFDSNPETTYLIPAKPVVMNRSERIGPHSGVGLALNGVKLEAPAPIDAIIGAYTIAPFDDCGGHVNPHVGYHYHAVTECTKKIALSQEHAALLGYAMDGFMLFSHKNTDNSVPEDLDSCGGHEVAEIGYHYHVNSPGENRILGCFKGESGCSTEKESTSCMNTRRGRAPRPNRPKR